MKKFIISLVAIISAFVVMAAPVYADEKCTLTSILGNAKCDSNGNRSENGSFNCSCDDGQGSSIEDILDLVIDIMTVGVGILGVIGISVVGIQYLTAGGDEGKTRNAKRRMFEIVIGLIVYAIFYAILTFFNINKT